MSAQKFLRLLGSVVRQTGQTLDSIGLKIQGKYGYKEGGMTQTNILCLLVGTVCPRSTLRLINSMSNLQSDLEGYCCWEGTCMCTFWLPQLDASLVLGDPLPSLLLQQCQRTKLCKVIWGSGQRWDQAHLLPQMLLSSET